MKEIKLLNNPNIFTEGETEKNLISTLFLGRVRIVNLWNTNEKALTPLFTVLDKKSVIIIVCDTDVVTDAHKKRFVSNINKLAKLTNNKIHILVHKLNFEDELAYADIKTSDATKIETTTPAKEENKPAFSFVKDD